MFRHASGSGEGRAEGLGGLSEEGAEGLDG